MFDPLTVICDIDAPWGKRHTLIRVWHKDPCSDNTDSSCQHRIERRKLNRHEKALSDFIFEAGHIFDNRPHYPDSREHRWYGELKTLCWEWKKRRTWALSWRWHIWHWRFQFPPLQPVWRYFFSRCCLCKQRFSWREEVLTNWDGDRFWHHRCDNLLRPDRHTTTQP